MSNIISAIEDDMDDYEYFCRYFGEKVQYDKDGSPACYGEHSREIEKRFREAQKKT